MSDIRERALAAYREAEVNSAWRRAREEEQERLALAQLLHRILGVMEDAIVWAGQMAWVDGLCFGMRGSRGDRSLYLIRRCVDCREDEYRPIVDLASLGREIATEWAHACTLGHRMDDR